MSPPHRERNLHFGYRATAPTSGTTPAATRSLPKDEPPAALVETSEPSLLHIAVRGASCYPHVWLSVRGGPQALELDVHVSKAVLPSGIQCGDLLLTHVLEMQLSTPVDLDQVALTATGPAGG